mmetsp:Transcript_7438/g.17979  ORF Transcript_7438/g.17979 Transcript_7438/m.17979 type:complete len:202 (-) Transcript_7438:260-865(-)
MRLSIFRLWFSPNAPVLVVVAHRVQKVLREADGVALHLRFIRFRIVRSLGFRPLCSYLFSMLICNVTKIAPPRLVRGKVEYDAQRRQKDRNGSVHEGKRLPPPPQRLRDVGLMDERNVPEHLQVTENRRGRDAGPRFLDQLVQKDDGRDAAMDATEPHITKVGKIPHDRKLEEPFLPGGETKKRVVSGGKLEHVAVILYTS